MDSTIEICILCAWRDSCQKKYSVSGRDMRCPDFVRDLCIKEDKTTEKGGEEENKK